MKRHLHQGVFFLSYDTMTCAIIKQVKSEAQAIVVVGWVQSDTNRWAAKKQFIKYRFKPIVYINHYFEPYNVYCPS